METRAYVCLTVVLMGVLLFVWGARFNREPVHTDAPNDTMGSHASEFVLNRAVAAGRLFRDAAGLLRMRSSAACPT